MIVVWVTLMAIIVPEAFAKRTRIAWNGAETTGRLVSKSCQNKSMVSYSYSVSGALFTGRDHRLDLCQTAEPGSQLEIFYGRTHPDQSYANDPARGLVADLEGVAAGLLLFALIIARGATHGLSRNSKLHAWRDRRPGS